MAIGTKEQLFGRFGNTTKKIKVKAWNMEVEIRKLTVAESNSVNALLYADVPAQEAAKGKVEVSIGKMNESATLAVSFALVNPALTLLELGNLIGAMEGITEIKQELDVWDKPKKSKAGSTSLDSPSPSVEPSKSSKTA